MKKTKKNSDKFVYPHPILKSFTSISQQTQQAPPSAYQNFHISDPGRVSKKMLRLTHNELLLGSSFSMMLHLLHPKIEVSSYENKYLLSCKKCKSYLNSSSMAKISLFQHRCLICDDVNQSEFGTGRYIDLDVVDTVSNQKAQFCNERRIIFTIEANEFIYDKKVTTAIFQTLRALSHQTKPQLNKSLSEQTQKSSSSQTLQPNPPTQLQIGFLLFDSQRHYLINMSTMQLIVLNPSQFTNLSQFPLTIQQIVQPLNQVDLDQLEEIVEMLMYQAYQLRSSCLVDTLRFCSLVGSNWGVETKVFAISYDSVILDHVRSKKSDKKELNLVIDSRVQLQIFNYSLYRDLHRLGLQKNLEKFHEYSKIKSSDIYYELYHTLTQETYYNIKLTIATSKLIDCSQKTRIIPKLTSNRPLLIDMMVLKSMKTSKTNSLENQQYLKSQCIYINADFGSFQRNIIYKLPKINNNLGLQPYLLNDQTFFYAMLSKFLIDPNVASVKKAVNNKAKEIINRVMKMQDDQFTIPRNLTNFFMYAFLTIEHDPWEKKNIMPLVSRQNFINQGLETIVKKIYPKVYQFYPELRPLKFKPKSFLHDTIRLVDNGKFLGLVVGDEVSHQVLMSLLNVRDIGDAIDWRQIPELNSQINCKLREAIELLRDINELYYLPLKIIRFDSEEYEENYGNCLYSDQDHRQFFLKLLKN